MSETCFACGGPKEAAYPRRWHLSTTRNDFQQGYYVWLVQRCCGTQANTEPVALVCDYGHDGFANAEMIVRLVNAERAA